MAADRHLLEALELNNVPEEYRRGFLEKLRFDVKEIRERKTIAEAAYKLAKEQRARKDTKSAFENYHKAAALGNKEAQFVLGYEYNRGQYLEKNPAESLNWYERAAEGGSPGAMFNLATLLEFGSPEEQLRAFKWYSQYQNLTEVEDETLVLARLGRMLEDGRGVAQDLKKAQEYYERALEPCAYHPVILAHPDNKKDYDDIYTRCANLKKKISVSAPLTFSAAAPGAGASVGAGAGASVGAGAIAHVGATTTQYKGAR